MFGDFRAQAENPLFARFYLTSGSRIVTQSQGRYGGGNSDGYWCQRLHPGRAWEPGEGNKLTFRESPDLHSRSLSHRARSGVLPFPTMGEIQSPSGAGSRRFAFYAWCVLAYNLLVILWGAVVRATGSGAGCGEHWPLCQGVVIPHAAQLATLIEFAHRISSGAAVVLVILLLVAAFRLFPSGHAARRYAVATLVFTLTEGLIGAALVLFGQVGTNASLTRALILSLHLTNTFLLLAALALTANSAGSALPAPTERNSHHRDHRGTQRFFSVNSVTPVVSASSDAKMKPKQRPFLWYGAGLLGALATALTGTIAALSDTLFRATSLAQGFQMDFSAAVSPLLRLRVIHPVVAAAAGGYLIFLGSRAVGSPVSVAARRLAYCLLALVTFQFLLGLLNLALLAPLSTQLLHLLTADLVWIALVLLSSEVLGARQPIRSATSQHRRTLETDSAMQLERTTLPSTLTATKEV